MLLNSIYNLTSLNLLAQAEIDENIRAIVSAQNKDTTTPDEAMVHEGSYWFPRQASEFAAEVDFLNYAIFWISTIFFAAICGVMFYFCWKYRRKGGVIDPQPSSSHNTAIEILWSVLPSIILVWIFYYGAESYFEMRIPREDAEEIQVTASRWNWLFTYPDGDTSAELHLVVDRPVKLVMRSDDVLHSMFIPAFRQKMDIVPGRYTYAYLTPSDIGQYRLACTEYCGREHSKMGTLCEVHPDDQHRKDNTQWIEEEWKPWKNGERIYKINCSGCHKVDGQAATGPALNTIWGDSAHRDMNGRTFTVDENYVRESIYNPDAVVVEGYGPVTKMNSFQGKLSDKDVDYVIAYLKELKNGDVTADGKATPGDSSAASAESSAAPTENE